MLRDGLAGGFKVWKKVFGGSDALLFESRLGSQISTR
jgi:hypothetical protein